MSGGPPHHPHGGRQAPPPTANTAWNHLQVPNFFPTARQPQHAHMSNDHSILHHQPTWHTPTAAEPLKPHHSHIFGLEQMLSDRQYTSQHHHHHHQPPPQQQQPPPPPQPQQRHSPGVDLTLTTRNGAQQQNGEEIQLPQQCAPSNQPPISLSVRDTNKINSLPPSALEIDTTITTTNMISSVQKSSISPILPVPTPPPPPPSTASTTTSSTFTTSLNNENKKRSSKRVDSILERLNPNLLDSKLTEDNAETNNEMKISTSHSVIVQNMNSSHDENSNSSSLNVPTPTNLRDDEVVSPYSNDDSLDSNKSRRKRKPCKTMRVTSKDDEKIQQSQQQQQQQQQQHVIQQNLQLNENNDNDDKDKSILNTTNNDKSLANKINERRHSLNLDSDVVASTKTRRKTSSESETMETIDNIAAMVQQGLNNNTTTKPITVSVIKTNDNSIEIDDDDDNDDDDDDTNEDEEDVKKTTTTTTTTTAEFNDNDVEVTNSTNCHSTIVTPAQKKERNTNFVEVENKLEEMFAGIEDNSSTATPTSHIINNSNNKNDVVGASTSHDNVTSTSNEPIVVNNKNSTKKAKRRKGRGLLEETIDNENAPKKKAVKRLKNDSTTTNNKNGRKKKHNQQQQQPIKMETNKDVYAYDSGSNASSSKSRGPFIQIRGPRDSPLSVNVVNAPLNEDEIDKKSGNSKIKKFHDDIEYRHKVRQKGLHSSTLSHQYDAQTKDATWICAFCKRGPHAWEFTGPSLNGNIAAPGDLFGPYFITTNSPEYERRLDDPYDKQFKSKKITKVLNSTMLMMNQSIIGNKNTKKKRKHSINSTTTLTGTTAAPSTTTPTTILSSSSFTNNDLLNNSSIVNNKDDIYLGITHTSSINGNTYEIWAHEDCIIWSPGTYLVGSKIIGLEEAIWTCCNVVCGKCHYKGANICCLKRGCVNVMHVCCARLTNWQFDQDNFNVYCPEHSLKQL